MGDQFSIYLAIVYIVAIMPQIPTAHRSCTKLDHLL